MSACSPGVLLQKHRILYLEQRVKALFYPVIKAEIFEADFLREKKN